MLSFMLKNNSMDAIRDGEQPEDGKHSRLTVTQ